LKRKSKREYQKRDPYQTAYQAAAKRLEAAKRERIEAQQKLAELNAEIPRLEGIVRVLVPTQAKFQVSPATIRQVAALEKAAAAVMPIVTPPPEPTVDDLPGDEDTLLESSAAAQVADKWK
jgi:hypothetical protein